MGDTGWPPDQARSATVRCPHGHWILGRGTALGCRRRAIAAEGPRDGGTDRGGDAAGLALAALAAPLGVAVGRVGWRLIAERVPLEQVSPFAAVAIAALIPAALVVAQVVAFGPGRRVARLRPGEVLRTE